MTARPEASVHAAGTIRPRPHALGTVGYPHARLANWLGMTEYQLSQLLTASTVPMSTARLVANVYNRLSCADPATHGVDPVSVRHTKARAAAARWAPVGAWDDDTIDDPAAIAEWTGHCGKARGVDLHERHGIPLCPPCQAALYRRRLRNAAHERRSLSTSQA
jgi:hypothetical protein